MSKNMEQEVLKIESDLLRNINDPQVRDRVFAEDYTFTNPSGMVKTREQIMADARAGKYKYESVESDDVKVRIHGNTAIVTSRVTQKGRYGDMDISGQFRYTRVYVKDGNTWQLLHAHSTPVTR